MVDQLLRSTGGAESKYKTMCSILIPKKRAHSPRFDGKSSAYGRVVAHWGWSFHMVALYHYEWYPVLGNSCEGSKLRQHVQPAGAGQSPDSWLPWNAMECHGFIGTPKGRCRALPESVLRPGVATPTALHLAMVFYGLRSLPCFSQRKWRSHEIHSSRSQLEALVLGKYGVVNFMLQVLLPPWIWCT